MWLVALQRVALLRWCHQNQSSSNMLFSHQPYNVIHYLNLRSLIILIKTQ